MPKRIKRKTPRAEAQTYMEGYAARGLSANKALKNLRKMGLGYKRTIFLADYRTYTGKEKAKDVAKHIRKDKYPTDAVMTPDVRNLRDKYQSLVKYVYYDRDTHRVEERNFYIGHDELITVRAIEETALKLIPEFADARGSEYNVEVLSCTYRGTRYRVD